MFFCFFFTDTATTETYTYCHPLSLHAALPISLGDLLDPCDEIRGAVVDQVVVAILPGQLRLVGAAHRADHRGAERLGPLAEDQADATGGGMEQHGDRKSTRLNSSH